ncbi:MAG: endonuclease/exonuclease/phosphatase family protein [Candidatus Marinimicrobia bacterium]|nr:endonuclease/exonuclease/phosphatase family protein [Candidatus Neomarinimicrobiota bacterium]MBL7023751.1 endonuclease/exonuclease/phosphatase family protein [Candidatus Neomarinimicrobiota bacterium]MBL7108948.1 endonuclease/exonuclease/phosphatase family protein [Candidatus Neomarinimicrobiota bacterium]
MRILNFFFLVCSFTIIIYAIDIDDLTFGEESTFEVMTWNIEWFPKNGQTTVDNVTQIIQALDVDLIAMQELDDTLIFNQMMDDLADFEGYFQSGWFAGLAYIYKPEIIEINDIYEIYTTSEYWNAFPRSPMVMDLNFMGENIFVINNHFKCCGDEILDFGNEEDEEYRRYMASELLKEYIDTNLPNKKVIVLGDLNDVLTDDLNNNVYQMILDDAENYLFADIEIAQGDNSNWSYPWWPSHIDHILITNELFDDFNHSNSDLQTIKIDEYLEGGFDEYYDNISDHRPVGLKLEFSTVDIDNELEISNYNLMKCYPNPFNPTTTISYSIPLVETNYNASLQVYNVKGQLVETLVSSGSKHDAGYRSVVWDAANYPSGIYLAKLQAENFTQTQKMVLLK